MDEKKNKDSKIKNFFSKLIKFIINPHFLLCFGIAWLITNGWSYIMLGIGTYFKVGWMIKVSSAYLAFLWLPISPEKIVTFAISIALIKLIFPKDEKTLKVLTDLFNKAKNSLRKKKNKNEEESIDNNTEISKDEFNKDKS